MGGVWGGGSWGLRGGLGDGVGGAWDAYMGGLHGRVGGLKEVV